MLFMNEMDIEEAVTRYRNHPVLAEATQLLDRFKDVVNANSDGWAYWSAAPRAAKKLIELILSQETRGRAWNDPVPEVTKADLKKATTPIKSLCTRHKLEFPG